MCRQIDGFTNAQEEVSELKKIIPPGVKISAGQQLAPQFLFRNTLYGEQRPEGEFVLYHIGDDPISVSLEQHRKNLEDPALTPVWSRRLDDGRTLLLFRRGADLPRLRPYGTVRPARVRPAAPAGSHGRWNPLLHGDLPAGRKRRCAGPAQAAAET